MNDEQMYIYEEAECLSLGETTRNVQCPRCGRDKSFSITRKEDNVQYNCFRALCPCSGTISLTGLDKVEAKNHKISMFRPKFYRKPLYRLTEPLRHLITSTWGVSTRDQVQNGFKWARDDGRLYIPVYNHLGELTGATCKVLDKCDIEAGSPKNIVYNHMETPKLDFTSDTLYKTDYVDKETVIIVEDKLSAVRVSKYVPCVSIGGVFLSEEAAIVLSSIYKNLVIALDADTWHTNKPVGKRLKDLYGLYFDEVINMYIGVDFKNMKEEELICALDWKKPQVAVT